MPKYYCDYCDAFLTHDSPSARKVHNSGRKHKENVYIYYRTWMEQRAQKLVDAAAKAFMRNRLMARKAQQSMPVGAPTIPSQGLHQMPPFNAQIGAGQIPPPYYQLGQIPSQGGTFPAMQMGYVGQQPYVYPPMPQVAYNPAMPYNPMMYPIGMHPGQPMSQPTGSNFPLKK